MIITKEGDIVEFNNMTPSYLLRKLNNKIHTIGSIDNDIWISLEEDPENPKTKFHRNWLRVVREA